MQTFTIDSDNNITFYASLKQTEGSAEGRYFETVQAANEDSISVLKKRSHFL